MSGWLGGRVGWLVSWLVDRSERANAAPCESSLYLDDKEPNLTQWNGRMVMETAFNLHRRSLFVDSLKIGVLLARLVPSRFPPRSISRPSVRDEKGIVLYLYHRFDRILYSNYASPAQNGESLYDCPSPPIVTTRGPATTLNRKADSPGVPGILIKDARVSRRGKTSGVLRVLRAEVEGLPGTVCGFFPYDCVPERKNRVTRPRR